MPSPPHRPPQTTLDELRAKSQFLRQQAARLRQEARARRKESAEIILAAASTITARKAKPKSLDALGTAHGR